MADILGIGNALLDIFWFSDEESALPLALHPNRAAHVTPKRLDEIVARIPNPVYSAGGSAANALKTARMLGASCLLIGCTGTAAGTTPSTAAGDDDHWGSLFREEIARMGIESKIPRRNQPTGRCLVIHMPGSMTSIACAPGAAPGIDAAQITERDIASSRAVFFDGQLLRKEGLAVHTARLCATYNKPLALDIASTDMATRAAELIHAVSAETQLFLFMNQEEAAVLARAMDADPACAAESMYRKIAGRNTRGNSSSTGGKTGKLHAVIEKRGSLGAVLACGEGVFTIPGIQAGQMLDTTGCGDVFEGAWLHSVLCGLSYRDAAYIANRAASAKTAWPGSLLDHSVMDALAQEISAARPKHTCITLPLPGQELHLQPCASTPGRIEA